jgi:hypothetical protein
VRVHQNRRFWFGEDVLNARAAIGGDGVRIGQTEYVAREPYANEIATLAIEHERASKPDAIAAVMVFDLNLAGIST